MRIIRPTAIDATNLTASNVADALPAAYGAGTSYDTGDRVSVVQADGYTYKVYASAVDANLGNPVTDTDFWTYLSDTFAEYNAGTTYDIDVIVIDLTTDHAFQSMQASNTGHSLSDESWWLDLGPTNRFLMFDQSNSTQTSNGESIDVTVQVDGRADAVSILNLVGATAQVIMTTPEDGELHNETYNLVSDSGVTNWYEYFFEPIVRKGDLTIYDLPLNKDPEIRVILNEPGGLARIGALIIGQSRYVGYAVHPMRLGIQDYSRKDTDDFGNFTIIKRNFSKRANFKIAVDDRHVDALASLLADYRATPVVWVGVESLTSSWIYGFYREHDFDLSQPNDSYLNLDLEGLT